MALLAALTHDAISTSASFALVRLTMSVSVPSASLMRYIPAHLASGTMRESRAGFLGDPRRLLRPILRPVESALLTFVLRSDRGDRGRDPKPYFSGHFRASFAHWFGGRQKRRLTSPRLPVLRRSVSHTRHRLR